MRFFDSKNVGNDLIHAFRSTIQNPGFTLAVVFTLALGIAANTLIFSILHAALLRQLPYLQPERLYSLMRNTTESGQMQLSPFWSFPKYQVIQEQSRVLDVAAFFQQPFAITGTANTERLQVEFVTPNYFQLLGIQPRSGRVFLDADGKEPSQVAILGEDLWRRRFKADAAVIDQTIDIDKKTFTIVGVLPKHFRGQSGTAEVWIPIQTLPSFTFPRRLQTAYAHWHEVIARLKPNANDVELQTEIKRLGDRLAKAYPNDPGIAADQIVSLRLRQANIDPRLKESLVILFAAVGLVLLIACVNVANMMLARSIVRRKEMGIRLALGAGRSRIVQLLLTESGLFALAGGLLAVVLAVWGADLIRTLLPERQSAFGWHPFRVFSGIHLFDYPVLLFTFAVSCGAALLVGLPVALRLSNGNVIDTLKNGSGDRFAPLNYARLLISSEVAFSLILVVCAGLMIKSFWRLQTLNVGANTDQLLTLKIDYPRDYDSTAFQNSLLERVSAMPGVVSAAVASATPLAGQHGATPMRIVAPHESPHKNPPIVGFHIVSPDYFQTLGIPLLRGRSFNHRDRGQTNRVVIVNQTAARQFWPNQNAVGQRIRLGLGWEPPNDVAEIIGIASDVQYGSAEAAPAPDIYLSYLQPTGESSPFVIVRSDADPANLAPDLRAAIRRFDPNLPVYDIKTMKQRMGDANAGIRFLAAVLGTFAALALCLAAIGIFAITSYTVSGRKKEIAIRMALGSSKRNALHHTMKDIGLYILAGSLCGLLLALMTGKLFARLLFGVTPNDPFTIFASSALLILIALIACYLPARRATKIDPIATLRYE